MSKNDSTGDNIISKAQNKAYDDGYDRIFNKRKILGKAFYETKNPLYKHLVEEEKEKDDLP